MKELLAELGLNLKALVAGFAGGVVSALLIRNATSLQALSSVVAGTLTANFLTDPAARYLAIGEGPAGFLVGLTAMVLCQKFIELAARWKAPAKGGENA